MQFSKLVKLKCRLDLYFLQTHNFYETRFDDEEI